MCERRSVKNESRAISNGESFESDKLSLSLYKAVLCNNLLLLNADFKSLEKSGHFSCNNAQTVHTISRL